MFVVNWAGGNPVRVPYTCGVKNMRFFKELICYWEADMNIDEPLTGFEPSARLPTKIERLTDSSLTLRRYGVQLNDHHS